MNFNEICFEVDAHIIWLLGQGEFKFVLKYILYSRKKNLKFYYKYLIFVYDYVPEKFYSLIPEYGSWYDLVKLHEQTENVKMQKTIEKIFYCQLQKDIVSGPSKCFKYLPSEKKKTSLLRNVGRLLFDEKEYFHLRKLKSTLKSRYTCNRFTYHHNITKYLLLYSFYEESDILECENEWFRLKVNLDRWKDLKPHIYLNEIDDFTYKSITFSVLLAYYNNCEIRVCNERVFLQKTLFESLHLVFDSVKQNLFDTCLDFNPQSMIFTNFNMEIENSFVWSKSLGMDSFHIKQFLNSKKIQKKKLFDVITESYDKVDSL